MATDKITLFCWVQGDSSSFAVDIGRGASITHIKSMIALFRSIKLELYVANTPETDEAKTVFTFGNVLPGEEDANHWEKGDHSGARFDPCTMYGHIH